MFKKLKSDYEERQKKIGEVLDNTSKAMEAHKEGMLAMKKSMESLGFMMMELQNDYDTLRNETREYLDNLKKNPWLRLFGVR